MCHLAWLAAINCARAGEEKAFRAGLDGELQGRARSLHDRVDHEQRIFGVHIPARFSGGVNDKAKLGGPFRSESGAHVACREGANVTPHENDRRMFAEVRSLGGKRFRVATEHDHSSAEA